MKQDEASVFEVLGCVQMSNIFVRKVCILSVHRFHDFLTATTGVPQQQAVGPFPSRDRSLFSGQGPALN